MEEVWKPIPEFRNYCISNFGRIYNIRFDKIMCSSINNHGYLKISLKDDVSGERFTRSVTLMVAEAFVEPPNDLCDKVIVLDGDLSNAKADNLAWRPKWYAYHYFQQLRSPQPIYYKNLFVQNSETGVCYNSIIEAGMSEGLLFNDIWRSTYTGVKLFPHGSVFQIIARV